MGLAARALDGTRRVVLRGVGLSSGVALGVGLGMAGARVGPALVAAPPVLAVGVATALRRPWSAPALVALASPIGLLTVPGLDVQVVEVAVVAAIGLTVVARLARHRAPLGWHPALWWLAGLTAVAVAGTPLAADVDAALGVTVLAASVTALVAATIGVCGGVGDLRRLHLTVVAAGAVIAVSALAQVDRLRGQSGGARVDGRVEGLFTSPNQLASMMAIVALLAVGAALASRDRVVRSGAVVVAVTATGALVFTLSRGGWFGLLLGAAVLLVVLPESRRWATRLVPPLGLAVAVVAAVWLPQTPPQVEIISQRVLTAGAPLDNPYDDRGHIWREAGRQILEAPTMGNGPGSFPTTSARSVGEGVRVAAHHAHNTPLTVGAELGLGAVALLLGATAALARVTWRVARARAPLPQRAIGAAAGAALASQLGQGTVDHTWTNPVVFAWLGLLIGLLLAADRLATTGRDAPLMRVDATSGSAP